MRTSLLIALLMPLVAPAGEPLPEGALKRLGVTSWRHGAGLSHVEASPDGKVVGS